MESKQFLVTGGSGFLGINLVRYLLGKGHKVRSLDLLPFDYPEADQVDWIIGDIRDQAMVEQCMEGVDMVVHCAAALPLYSKDEIFSTDIDGTRIIVNAARDKGAERCVHISSTAVYGIPDHHPLVEDDKLVGVGPYGEAKIKAEEECFKLQNEGYCAPVIRPKSFIGPERLGVFALFYDWAKDGHNFPMIGNGQNQYQLLDVEDLCDAIYACCELPVEQVNTVFNIGAEDFTTMMEDYQAVLDHAGHGKKIKGFPAWPMIATLRILEFFKLSPLYKWVYETAHKDSFVSIDRAKRLLNYAPKYSNKQALVRNYDWYLENLKSFEGQSGVTHRVPWKQGILGLVKKFF